MSDENNQNGHRYGDVAASAGAVMEMPREMAAQVADEIGGGIITRKSIQELSKVGVEADNYGLISIAGGALVMTAPALVELLEAVVSVSRKPKCSDRMKLNCAVAGAALGKAIQGIASSVKADGLVSQSKKPKQTGPKRIFAAQIAPPPTSVAA